MKKKTLIIIGIVLLVSLLIPIPQSVFSFILGTLFTVSLVFLLLTIFKKKIIHHSPRIVSILLITIVGLELHYTKNLIFGWDYYVFGKQLAGINYIVSFVILALILLFNIAFTINFIYKETIKFDPLSDMKNEFFRLDGEPSLSEEQKEEEKKDVQKTKDYFSHLQCAHKDILSISVITLLFAVIQFVVINFFKHGIILELTFGNMVGFNLIIFVSILMIVFAAFSATKKYRKLNS